MSVYATAVYDLQWSMLVRPGVYSAGKHEKALWKVVMMVEEQPVQWRKSTRLHSSAGSNRLLTNSGNNNSNKACVCLLLTADCCCSNLVH